MDRDLLRRTSEQVLAAVNALGRQQNVANLREWDLHGFAAPHANITKYGSYAFSTTIRSLDNSRFASFSSSVKG